MTNLSKLVAIATAASAVGFTANAQEQFEATIEYQPGNTIESTYQDISKQIARVCRKELRSYGKLQVGVALRFKSACQEELMSNAVQTINDPVLTAYFNGTQRLILQLASR